ncbi:MFNG acetylglucosaminyltransferase, partial [Columbina picui]|nr:MFNG acetylglucosaminyltransferase [Columbina picui]
MGRRLIRGLSGAAVFLVSAALLSMRHRGAQETARYSGLQQSKVSPEGGGGRGQKDLQVHPPEGYRTQGSLSLGDIFIAVKTTKRFHQSRMELLLDTWISRAREQTYVFTDEEDDALKRRMGNHAIFTNCSADHSHPALSCKMATEFDAFLASGQSWFCHLDDDNYLNPRALLKLLSSYSATWDVYLGKPSLNRPIRASETLPNNQTVQPMVVVAGLMVDAFISPTLLLTHVSLLYSSGKNFVSTSELIRLPDDCTVGYIIECKVGGQLLPNSLFHSHLENLQLIPTSRLMQQVTLSYGVFENKLNVIELRGPFSPKEDPSRY